MIGKLMRFCNDNCRNCCRSLRLLPSLKTATNRGGRIRHLVLRLFRFFSKFLSSLSFVSSRLFSPPSPPPSVFIIHFLPSEPLKDSSTPTIAAAYRADMSRPALRLANSRLSAVLSSSTAIAPFRISNTLIPLSFPHLCLLPSLSLSLFSVAPLPHSLMHERNVVSG